MTATAPSKSTRTESTQANSAATIPISTKSAATKPTKTTSQPQPAPSPAPALQSLLAARCEYRTATGRRCRSKSAPGEALFCDRHAQQEFRHAQRAAARAAARAARAANHQPPMRNFAAEILGPIKEFQTAASINHVLGRVLVLLAANRMPTRSAATIAYLCQLMLQSLPEVKQECSEALESDFLEKELEELVCGLPALRPSLGASKCKTGKQ